MDKTVGGNTWGTPNAGQKRALQFPMDRTATGLGSNLGTGRARVTKAVEYEKAILTALLTLPRDQLSSTVAAAAQGVALGRGLGALDATRASKTAPLPVGPASESAEGSGSSGDRGGGGGGLRTHSSVRWDLPPAPEAPLSLPGLSPKARALQHDPTALLRALTADGAAGALSRSRTAGASSSSLSGSGSLGPPGGGGGLPGGPAGEAEDWMSSLGAYPLATRDRVQLATLARLEKEAVLREKRAKAAALRAQIDAKKAAENALKTKVWGGSGQGWRGVGPPSRPRWGGGAG